MAVAWTTLTADFDGSVWSLKCPVYADADTVLNKVVERLGRPVSDSEADRAFAAFTDELNEQLGYIESHLAEAFQEALSKAVETVEREE